LGYCLGGPGCPAEGRWDVRPPCLSWGQSSGIHRHFCSRVMSTTAWPVEGGAECKGRTSSSQAISNWARLIWESILTRGGLHQERSDRAYKPSQQVLTTGPWQEKWRGFVPRVPWTGDVSCNTIFQSKESGWVIPNSAKVGGAG